MRAFFQCVAEAVVEHGARGLIDMVPGGKFVCDVAEGAWKKYRERKKDADIREEMRKIAQAGFEEARQAAAEAVREVTASNPSTAADDRLALELYLTQIPGAVRASLKRPEDPTGTTVPATFALSTPDEVLKLLPARPPKFRPGDPFPGKPGWVLAEPLGVGGFGEVWLARHPRVGSLTGAVKFCHGLRPGDRDLLHESHVIDRVMEHGKHPHIVPLLDVNLDAAAPWLMFEYVPGGDLADLIREWQGLPAADRLTRAGAALRELAGAVGHFHRLAPAVVHRDLKPSNILRDRTTGQLRITDFGIGGVTARAALEAEARGVTTRGGRLQSYLRGSYTPLYSSPQQRDGADPDPRDDVHALGVIGYQMLTGYLNQGIGSDIADDLRDAGAGDDLIALLGRCVAQKPDRRPADAAELRDRLQAVSAPMAPSPTASSSPKEKPQPLPIPETKPQATRNTNAPRGVWGTFRGLLGLDQATAVKKAIQRAEEFIDRRRFPKSLAERVKCYRLAAENGHPASQQELGDLYQMGWGVPKDERLSAEWCRLAVEGLRKAAAEGDAAAQYQLGGAYNAGRGCAGIVRDVAEAARWWQKAAEQGHLGAQVMLGYAYEQAWGVVKNEATSAEWFRKAIAGYRRAAEQGDARAQVELARLYEWGKGVPQDPVEALRWYRKAAEQGDPYSQTSLAYAFLQGNEVRHDYAEAMRWFRMAAEQGDGCACLALGREYESGRIVPRDDNLALEWYRKGAAVGDLSADDCRKRLEGKLRQKS